VHDLSLDGSKCRVIPREVQLDPVKDTPLHVDFQRVGPGARIRVNVPVRFINEALSPGLKRGGVLNIVRHEVEVTAPADAIPDHFEFNLEGLEIGRSVHISATRMPAGVRPTIMNRDFTVATIAGHKIEEEAATTPDAAAAVEGAAAPEGAEAAAAPAASDAKAPAKEAAAKAPAGKEAAKPAAGKK
jgi:large subunit ribosomal protein L25